MKLSIKNIGRMGAASVDINGITVIAGENNSGKSTVGRTLYSVFHGFYQIEEQINAERAESVDRLLVLLYVNSMRPFDSRPDTRKIARNIIKNIDLYKGNQGVLWNYIVKIYTNNDDRFEKYLRRTGNDDIISRIMDVLNVPDSEILHTVLEKKLDVEFNGQASNIYTEEKGEIRLQIKDQEMAITIKDNHVIEVKNRLDLHTEAIYIDDPFVLDDLNVVSQSVLSKYVDHRKHLKEKLLRQPREVNIVDQIVASNKLEEIDRKIASACSGEIVRNKRSEFEYKKENTEKLLDIRNLSTGLKTFAILKMLLQNGTIEYNGTIILDEPEIHLHPEWQLLFAELIVLIHKEFGVHILLNTHSPYFLNAIEVYAAKYGVDDACKYYLASVKDDFSYVEDVSNHIEAIYSKLARPLQDLENERNQFDV